MAIGVSDYRVDAPGKVTGATRYPGDLTAARLLHGKVLLQRTAARAHAAHGTQRGRAVPGVVAIFTATDVPVNEYGLILPDQPVLVGLGSEQARPADISRWEGDQVAVIVAETS